MSTSVTVTIVGRVGVPPTGTHLTNTVSVFSELNDPNPLNNTATVDTFVPEESSE
jgi:hypothetical protein